IVPLPLFATSEQLAHAIRSASIDYVVSDRQDRVCEALPRSTQLSLSPFTHGLLGIRFPAQEPAPALPSACWKVTFTSGTTATPKGVCLSLSTLERTADALRRASAGGPDDRHLCVTPLATLLENVGGVYAALIAGASVIVPPLADVGLSGSSALDPARLVAALRSSRATTAILVPQMLAAIVEAIKGGAASPNDLRFLAVGGAAVSARLLEESRALGLPVYEGYGLSECASVVAVNRPGETRAGSVGKPLPHVRVEIARDGEILVSGNACLGYLGGAASHETVATGDIGHLDEDGFLFISGRKKNMFITSFGRNVAPEWIEQALTAQPAIAQAAVFGEARPFAAAIIVPAPNASAASVALAIEAANRHLPDYARIGAWILAEEPFSLRNALATANGRLRRDEIFRTHRAELDALYHPPLARTA
ncbi:MAG TPA: AMP-binding protein, partial [Rhodanobacteraceae bacterium]